MISIGTISPFPDMNDMALATVSGSNFTLDSINDRCCVIFKIPATGTLSNIHYRIPTASSPNLTLRIQLRTVDTATGLPSAAGTLYGSSTSITVVNPTTGFKTAAVNCTGATAGDIVALVFDISAYTANSILIGQRFGSVPVGFNSFPYMVTNTGAGDVIANNAFNILAFEYSTGYFPLTWGCVVAGTMTQPTVANSGTTRRGNRLRTAVGRRAVGMWVVGDLDGDCLLRLRLASDDSILATATLDKDVRGTTGTGSFGNLFDSVATVNLAAGVDYYALLEGNSATTCAINLLSSIISNAQMDQLAGGKNIYGTSYAGSYSDDNTSRYAIGILYDALESSVPELINSGGLVG